MIRINARNYFVGERLFMMKKSIIAILVLLILSLTACVSDAPAAPTPAPTPEPTVAPTADPVETAEPEPSPSADQISPAEILELQSGARWLFEQRFLPSVVFEFHEEIIDYISEFDEDGMESVLLWAWEYVTAIFAEYELGDQFALAEESRPLETFGLGDEHIAEVTIEQLNEDSIGAIIKMLDIGEVRRSTYIGIVYTEDSELRMFTLEQSYGFHMFCFVGVESRGSFFEVENDRAAFIEAIIDVLETQAEPEAGIIWSR